MKKPVRVNDEAGPEKAARAGHFKSGFDTAEAAEASGRTRKSTYPMLQI
jgi:hypothetical protein